MVVMYHPTSRAVAIPARTPACRARGGGESVAETRSCMMLDRAAHKGRSVAGCAGWGRRVAMAHGVDHNAVTVPKCGEVEFGQKAGDVAWNRGGFTLGCGKLDRKGSVGVWCVNIDGVIPGILGIKVNPDLIGHGGVSRLCAQLAKQACIS